MSETIAKLLNQSCVLTNCNCTKAEDVISAVGMKLYVRRMRSRHICEGSD